MRTADHKKSIRKKWEAVKNRKISGDCMFFEIDFLGELLCLNSLVMFFQET